MKALVVEKPGTLVLRDFPEPEPGPHEALVQILACGICSTTDREVIKGSQPYHNAYPAILGHEAVGRVVWRGERVRNFRIGDLVTRPTSIWPGTQRDGMASGWGGFAEFGIVRDRMAMAEDGDSSMLFDYTALRQRVVLPGIGPEEAVLSIPLAETSSWLHQMPPVAGRAVCVAGTGIAGLSIALWCKLAGARKVVVLGRREERLEVAKRLGADAGVVVSSGDWQAQVKQSAGGDGVDLFVEAVGRREQVNEGLGLLAAGGTVGIYGVAPDQTYDLNWGRSCGSGSVQLSPASEHETYPWVWDLLKREILRAGDFLTHTWDFRDFETAFEEIAKGAVIKGLLRIGAG